VTNQARQPRTVVTSSGELQRTTVTNGGGPNETETKAGIDTL